MVCSPIENGGQNRVSIYVRIKPPSDSISLSRQTSCQGHQSQYGIKYSSENPTSISIEYKTPKVTDDGNRKSSCTLSNCHGVIGGSTSDLFATAQFGNTYVQEYVEFRKPGLICCYGQSNSGKTYTMFGRPACRATGHSEKGILHLAVEHLLSTLDNTKYKVSMIAFEIYDEQVIDLIPSRSNSSKIQIKQKIFDGEECNKVSILNMSTFEDAAKKVTANRSICSTSLNQSSSRSHCFVRIVIESAADNSAATSGLTFVDLAGSERQSKSKVSGDVLKEGIRINKSLMTLGVVIRSLSNHRESHIPWRESKLTSILRPFLQKRANVGFVLCISSEDTCLSESVSTLRFGAMLLDARLKEHVTHDLIACGPHTPDNQHVSAISPDDGEDQLEKIKSGHIIGPMHLCILDVILCMFLGSLYTLFLLRNFLDCKQLHY